MITRKITWKVLPNTGNPCKYCGKKEAEHFATIRINDAGSITTQLCDECIKLSDPEILGRILPCCWSIIFYPWGKQNNESTKIYSNSYTCNSVLLGVYNPYEIPNRNRRLFKSRYRMGKHYGRRIHPYGHSHLWCAGWTSLRILIIMRGYADRFEKFDDE